MWAHFLHEAQIAQTDDVGRMYSFSLIIDLS